MTEFVTFAVLGLGLGAVYALVAHGVIMIYRGSGVINFAQGTFVMVGAYAFYELQQNAGLGLIPSLAGAVILGAILGLATEAFVMRPLRSAPAIMRMVATLGLFLVLEAVAALRYSDNFGSVNPFLTAARWHLGRIYIPLDQLELLGIALGLTLVLAALKRWSLIGLATSASAESERGVSTLGWSPFVLASVNWGLGGAFAGLAGALIAPIAGLDVENLSLLVIPGLAAALVGEVSSFVVAFVAAVAIGVFQSLSAAYISQPGLSDAIPFLVIIVVLVITGRSLPLRDHIGEKLPSIGTGKIGALPAAVAVAIAGVLVLAILPVNWTDAVGVSAAYAVILLSVVVVTGYAGQVSLVQVGLAGVGAFVAGRLIASQGWPLWAATLAAIAAAIPVGAICAFPAVRTRGVNLAIVTLGLAVVLQQMLFQNVSYTGKLNGTNIGYPTLFGWDVDAVRHSNRWAFLCLATLVLMMVIVANVRRSPTGRRLLAIRENERGAASLGVSVARGKIYAFALASAIAAVGGILVAFRTPQIVYAGAFDPVYSIQVIAYAVIGGVAYVSGPLLGSLIVAGGVVALLDPLFHSLDRYLPLIAGVGLLVVLITNPDGQVPALLRWKNKRRWAPPTPSRWQDAPSPWRKARGARRVSGLASPGAAGYLQSIARRDLKVEGLTVRYGGVTAVSELSLTVGPGEVVGLIGPNGAGKTSLVDGITGFTRVASGRVSVGGREVTRAPAHRRADLGLVRSWQSLELFEDISVRENLQIASDPRRWWHGAAALARRPRTALTPLAAAAVHEFAAFGLEDEIERRVSDLSFSQRRVVATARALARGPSVLVLDEPTAGMSDARREELSRAIRRLATDWGLSLLIVDHDMPFVMAICDRIVVMDRGRKIAEGTPPDIRGNKDVASAYLRSPASDENTPPAHGPGSAADLPAIETPTAGRGGSAARASRPTARGNHRDPSELLAATDMSVGWFGHSVVRDLTFSVSAGEIVALLGANRAGKTTTLLGLAGEIRPLAGGVRWLREPVGARVPLHRRARQGLGYVTDERSVFRRLTVEENLRVGRCDTTVALELFPELKELMRRRAGVLSGGEQQMLGLGRALARRPKVLLVDEMSLGLAPIIVHRLLGALRAAADQHGVGIVLVEQHVDEALNIADRVCVISGGRMTLEGPVWAVGHQVHDAFLAGVVGDRTALAPSNVSPS